MAGILHHRHNGFIETRATQVIKNKQDPLNMKHQLKTNEHLELQKPLPYRISAPPCVNNRDMMLIK